MKKTIIITAIIIICLGIILLWPTSPNSSLPQADTLSLANTSIDNEVYIKAPADIVNELKSVDLLVTGFGPGKSHPGTFTDFDITNVTVDENGKINGGTATVNVVSRDFGIEKLNEHLCADNFFDCTKYPTIQFILSEVKQNSDSQFTVIGDLTFKNITKTISVPVVKTGEDFLSNFRLNVAQFGFTYVGVDAEVEIQIKNK